MALILDLKTIEQLKKLGVKSIKKAGQTNIEIEFFPENQTDKELLQAVRKIETKKPDSDNELMFWSSN